MVSKLSPWAQRVEQLVDFTIAQKEYTPDVAMTRVDTSLTYFAMGTAKYLHQMEQDIPRENPWVASLMLYVCLGDTPSGEMYSEQTEFEAGKCIGQALRAGWSVADMLQAIEWNKTAMVHYPTVEQWAGIFEVAPEVVVKAQHGLVSRIVDTLSAAEQSAWSAACSLDVSFEHWKSQLTVLQAPILSLPELGMDT